MDLARHLDVHDLEKRFSAADLGKIAASENLQGIVILNADGQVTGSSTEPGPGLIREALEKTGFNQTQAAGLLGLSERMLRYKLKKYGLK